MTAFVRASALSTLDFGVTMFAKPRKSCTLASIATPILRLDEARAIKLWITSLNDKLTPAEKRRSGRKKDGWN